MPIDELGLVAKLKQSAKSGYGLELTTPDDERAEYWGNVARRLRLECAEAAAAIERLLAERDEANRQIGMWQVSYTNAQDRGDAWMADAKAAEAQRDKLKEALTKIDAAFQNAVRGNGNFERDLGWTGSNDNMGEIFAWFARQALKDTPS